MFGWNNSSKYKLITIFPLEVVHKPFIAHLLLSTVVKRVPVEAFY